MRIIAGLASACALALTVAAGSAQLAVTHFENNVTKIDISDQVGQRPIDYGNLSSGAVNILMMGSDSRTGKGNNKGYGHIGGARSDTAMLMHIYPNRKSAIVVSIPRDTVVQIPDCVSPTGVDLLSSRARFNDAYSRGGPGCTLKTVEAMSGLRVDHFVVLDFNGFKKSIKALGGVEVCLTRPLVDARSGVNLPAGRTRVSGEDALAFVRVRHNIGDGSDLGRINRQQIFLSSIIQEVTRSGLMTDPLRLWQVMDQSTKALATDPGMADPKGIVALANSVASIDPGKISFLTLPWLPSGDGATVVVDEAKATPIWEAIAAQEHWPPAPTKGSDGHTLKVAPSTIVLAVHNATGTDGQGLVVSQELGTQGFVTASIDAPSQTATTTVIRYGPNQLDAARTLQAAVKGASLIPDDAQANTLDLTLGQDYRGLRTLRLKSDQAAPTQSAKVTTAAQDICTG